MQWYARSAVLRPRSAVEAAARASLPQPTDFAEHGYILRGASLSRTDERILDVGCGSSLYRLASRHAAELNERRDAARACFFFEAA